MVMVKPGILLVFISTMFASAADSDGAFGGGGVSITGVGFSDTAILIVSLLGFVFLATTVYSLILLRVQSKEEFEKAEEEKLDYGEQLERADVATLTRAQRRQRAQLIMKRNRRAAPVGGHHEDPGADDDDIGDDHVQGQHLSRKERQKAAKAAEREERKLFEEQRREMQKDAQEAAKREKKERERLEAERLEEERKLRLLAKEAQEQAEYEEWNTFLTSPNEEETMTVAEFVIYAQEEKVVSIDRLADRFQRPSEQVCTRIQELVSSCRLTGVIDGGRFIYITPDEMDAVAQSILEKKQITLTDLANSTSSLIKI